MIMSSVCVGRQVIVDASRKVYIHLNMSSYVISTVSQDRDNYVIYGGPCPSKIQYLSGFPLKKEDI